MVTFEVNGVAVKVNDAQSTMPLLWYLREEMHLKGTKFGCGIGQCGACTVHINNTAVRSCSVTLAALQGQSVKTIEGLASGDTLHPVQQAWLDIDVPQCGYCQAGQIMAAAALLKENHQPSDADIDNAMTNICRCATYVRIRQAIKHAAELL